MLFEHDEIENLRGSPCNFLCDVEIFLYFYPEKTYFSNFRLYSVFEIRYILCVHALH